MDTGSRKRLRRRSDGEVGDTEDAPGSVTINDGLLEASFPKNLESRFATAIFELGLKHSSPKILMPLMPSDANLNTEHIKSHLQKYRIHRQRSKDEFMDFYNSHMKDSFQQWENNQGWKRKFSATQGQNLYSHSTADNQTSSAGNGSFYTNHFHTGSEQDDSRRMASTSHSRSSAATTSIAPVEEKNAYINDLYRDAEVLLQSLHGLCQEAVQGAEDLKLKPDILKGLMSGMK